MPKGIVASGFPRVRETSRKIGIEFRPWQTDLNRCLLAKTPDGMFAADTVVMSIPRQVGKTFDVGAVVFAECIAEPNTTVIWTAHRFKVSRETFNELRALARSPKLAPHIDYDAITTAAGNECIPFRNGSRIVFAARERGAIRGFTKVRILILDEGQILTYAVLADLVPTMNQAKNPLVIVMGTPPKPTDPGEVFAGLRAEALSGESDGIFYVELSADADADLDDRKQWAKANPSYPADTPARAILRMRKLLSEDDFRREALGIWDDDGSKSPISATKWSDLADLSPDPAPHVGRIVLAVDSDPLLQRTTITACGVRGDGLPLLEMVENLPGVDWAEQYVKDICENKDNDISAVVIDKRSTAATLIHSLTEAHMPVIGTDAQQMAQACGLFITAVNETGELRHLNQAELNIAIRAGITRPLGDAVAWDRKKPTVDITPLTSATLALWGHLTGAGVAKNAGRGRVIAL